MPMKLEQKFTRFFRPRERIDTTAIAEAVNLPEIESRFSIEENNWLFFVRESFSYELDLRSLGVFSENGKVIIDPGSVLSMDFSVQTPWGAWAGDNNSTSLTTRNGQKQLIWHLEPTEVNHIEASFWLPSPIGIGTMAIVLVACSGFYLKHKHFPGVVVKH